MTNKAIARPSPTPNCNALTGGVSIARMATNSGETYRSFMADHLDAPIICNRIWGRFYNRYVLEVGNFSKAAFTPLLSMAVSSLATMKARSALNRIE